MSGKPCGICDDGGDSYGTRCDKYGLGSFSAVKIGAKPIEVAILALAFD